VFRFFYFLLNAFDISYLSIFKYLPYLLFYRYLPTYLILYWPEHNKIIFMNYFCWYKDLTLPFSFYGYLYKESKDPITRHMMEVN